MSSPTVVVPMHPAGLDQEAIRRSHLRLGSARQVIVGALSSRELSVYGRGSFHHLPSGLNQELIGLLVIGALREFRFREGLFEVTVQFLAPGVHFGP
jgi:hypothetical protein